MKPGHASVRVLVQNTGTGQIAPKGGSQTGLRECFGTLTTTANRNSKRHIAPHEGPIAFGVGVDEPAEQQTENKAADPILRVTLLLGAFAQNRDGNNSIRAFPAQRALCGIG
jgi:hypothetical protein